MAHVRRTPDPDSQYTRVLCLSPRKRGTGERHWGRGINRIGPHGRFVSVSPKYVFSAKGADLSVAWGSAPGTMNQESGPSAESAIHFLRWFNGYGELCCAAMESSSMNGISGIAPWTLNRAFSAGSFVFAYSWGVAPA
jgi:hypothetical protein